MIKNQLWIKCSDLFDQIEWKIYSSKTNISSKQGKGSLADLQQHVDLKNYQITVLMLSTKIYVKDLKLPKSSLSMTNLIVLSLMEENIVSDIEDMHFAHSKLKKNATLGVAVIENDLCQKWLKILQQQGLQVKVITPLYLTFPNVPNEWQVWYDDSFSAVKISEHSGFCVEHKQLPFLLESFYHKFQEKPATIHIYSSQEKKSEVTAEKFGLLSSFIKVHYIDSVWQLINIKNISINLLQGQYASEAKNKRLIFSHGISIMVFIIFALIATPMMKIAKLDKVNEDLLLSINSIYKELYPNATAVVSPKLRMEQELKNQSLLTRGVFFNLLNMIGSGINETQVNIVSLSYKNDTLSLTTETSNFNDIEKVLTQLKASGIKVQKGATEQRNGKYLVVIDISKENS